MTKPTVAFSERAQNCTPEEINSRLNSAKRNPAFYKTSRLSFRKLNNINALFCPVVPDIPEKTALFEDQEVSSLVFLVRVGNICGMIRTGNNRRSRRKAYPSATASTANLTRTGSRPNRASTERSRRLTCLNDATTLKTKRTLHYTDRLISYLTHTEQCTAI
jgi:hypothetical protein